MPLAVNGKPLDFVSKDANEKLLDPVARVVVAPKIAELLKTYKDKWPVRIKYHPSLYRFNPDNPNRPHCPASYPILPVAIVIGKDGPEEWRYYKNARPRTGGGFDFDPPWIDFSGNLILTAEDVDLLVFLKYYSHQNFSSPSRRKKCFVIEDKRAEAQEELSLTKLVSRIEYLITNDVKVGGLGEVKVRALARNYEINADASRSVEEVQKDLVEHLRTRRRGGNSAIYEQFLKDTNMGDAVELKALIQEAKDKKLIGIKKGTGTARTWFYTKDEGKGPVYLQPIINITPGKNEKQELFDYLSANPSEVEGFKKVLESV